MFTTILGLLAFLAVVCVALWLIIRALSKWLQPYTGTARERLRNLTGNTPTTNGESPKPPQNPAPWIPTPPDTTLLRVDGIAIAQARNPAPMLRTRAIEGAALWYRAPLPYREIVAWYVEHLTADGWQEEAGHIGVHVFQRARTLLWLADGSDPNIWRSITRPNADPPRRSTQPDEGPHPTFTILTYRTDGYVAR